MTQSERLEVRLSPEQKALVERAAELPGRTVTDFVLSSLQQAAEAVIREHEIMTLTAQDSRVFVELLLHPPAPNERLRTAAVRYKQELTGRQE